MLAARIGGVRGPVIEQDLVERFFAVRAADDLQRLARRADPQPRREIAAAGVIRDLRVGPGEQLDAQRLLDLVRGAAAEPQPAQRDVDLRHQVFFERLERGGVAGREAEREEQIRVAQLFELGLGIIAQAARPGAPRSRRP